MCNFHVSLSCVTFVQDKTLQGVTCQYLNNYKLSKGICLRFEIPFVAHLF